MISFQHIGCVSKLDGGRRLSDDGDVDGLARRAALRQVDEAGRQSQPRLSASADEL